METMLILLHETSRSLLALTIVNVDMDDWTIIWTDKHKRAKRRFRLGCRKIPGSAGANRGAFARGRQPKQALIGCWQRLDMMIAREKSLGDT